jgi:hypothetical protein
MKMQTSKSAKPAVYVETSVVSYLAARTSADLVISAHQLITRRWWADASTRYDLCTSALVYDEAQNGKPTLAAKRVELLDTMRTQPSDQRQNRCRATPDGLRAQRTLFT